MDLFVDYAVDHDLVNVCAALLSVVSFTIVLLSHSLAQSLSSLEGLIHSKSMRSFLERMALSIIHTAGQA